MASADAIDLVTLMHLWAANAAAYGAKWTSRAGELPVDDDGRLTAAGGVWSRGLAGMPHRTIMAAVERHARVSAWPAELSELRALCLGVPTLAEVRALLRDEAAKKPPFVVLMFQHLDYYNWRMADGRQAERMLADAYTAAREHVLLGGELPKPPKGELEHDPRPAAPAAARPPKTPEQVFTEAREAFEAPPPAGKDAAAGPDQ